MADVRRARVQIRLTQARWPRIEDRIAKVSDAGFFTRLYALSRGHIDFEGQNMKLART
jgi:hypothetical protein